jgi:hypothetical protein
LVHESWRSLSVRVPTQEASVKKTIVLDPLQ